MKQPIKLGIGLGLGLAFGVFTQTSHALSNPSDNLLPKQYIVTFNDSTFDANSESVYKEGLPFAGTEVYADLNMASSTLSSSEVKSLQANRDIEKIELDAPIRVTADRRDWGNVKVGTEVSRSIGLTGAGVKVAVIDTGISNHADLIIKGGYNAITGGSYADDHGHGTHVAGTIAAKEDGAGLVGVAPGVDLYAVKALGASGSGYTSDIIKGIQWCIQNNMNIINMSLGSSSGVTALEDSVRQAKAAGITVVAAAGNDAGPVGYPAKYTHSVIAVSATDQNNAIASFSNRGPEITIAAPGVGIESTRNTGGTTFMSGTSMASPHVAGVMALYKQTYPTYSPDALKAVMIMNAKDIGAVGFDTLFGNGLIQTPKALSSETIDLHAVVTKNLPTSATITWDKLPGVTSYTVTYGTTKKIVTTNTLTLTGLKENTDYSVTVSVNVSGVMALSNVSFKTPILVVGSVGTVVPSAISFNKATFTWNLAENALSYKVVVNGKTYSATKNTLAVTGLAPDTTYNVQVYGVNGLKVGTSSTATFKTRPVNLTIPSTLTPSNVSFNTFKLSWSPALDATGYEVQYGTVKRTVSTPYVVLSGLSQNTAYTVKVTAINGLLRGATQEITQSTRPIYLPKPTMITETQTFGNISFSWAKIVDATSYKITINGKEYKTSATSFSLSGLLPNKTYPVTITATNGLYTGTTANLSYTTKPLILAASQNLRASSVTGTSATVSWSAVPNATSYKIVSSFQATKTVTSTSLRYTLLQKGTQYSVDVIPMYQTIEGPRSSVTFTTTN